VLESPTLLDEAVQELMDAPLPVVDPQVDLAGVTHLLSRQNPAVLVRRDGTLSGIVTRYDVLKYLTGA
jgi:cystathionine beta-synthase